MCLTKRVPISEAMAEAMTPPKARRRVPGAAGRGPRRHCRHASPSAPHSPTTPTRRPRRTASRCCSRSPRCGGGCSRGHRSSSPLRVPLSPAARRCARSRVRTTWRARSTRRAATRCVSSAINVARRRPPSHTRAPSPRLGRSRRWRRCSSRATPTASSSSRVRGRAVSRSGAPRTRTLHTSPPSHPRPQASPAPPRSTSSLPTTCRRCRGTRTRRCCRREGG